MCATCVAMKEDVLHHYTMLVLLEFLPPSHTHRYRHTQTHTHAHAHTHTHTHTHTNADTHTHSSSVFICEL